MGNQRVPCVTVASAMLPATKALQSLAAATAMTGAVLHQFGDHVRHAPRIGSTLTEAQRQRRHTRNTAQRKARKATRNHR
jgi:hypothetical protein